MKLISNQSGEICMNEAERLMNDYLIWKTDNINKKVGFFPVYSNFKEHMRELSPGAISLYLYFGIHSKNKTGESYHSIETIADFFGKSSRTISSWIKELEENQLIVRRQNKIRGVSTTYLRPYR